MENESRIKKSLRNIAFGLGGQLLSVLLSFACRTLFISLLGTAYLGVSGLFSNILSVLSLAELGVGSAITYSMYRPLAEKDNKQLHSLMHLYASIYRVIGCIVAVLGLLLIPFLDNIVKEHPNIDHLEIIYVMFLANSVVSYFFAYKATIIIADQKKYITAIYEYGFNILQYVVQMGVLFCTRNFLLYLFVQILCSFFYNYFISKQADKLYPFLKQNKPEKLDPATKKTIYKNIGAMVAHKIGGVVRISTDNILISMYVGVYWVGLYSNYSLIIDIVDKFLGQIFSAVSASIGNLNAQESKEKSYQVFTTAYFINFWLYGLSTVCFFVLFRPFITIWIGSQYTMADSVILIIVMNFYVVGMRKMVLAYRDSLGLFWNDRYKPVFEATINLGASLFLVQKIGITGVFWGTFISFMTTCFWIEPYILYKHGFKKKVWIHFAKYVIYAGITCLAVFLTQLACSIFTTYTLSNFVGRAIFCLLIPNIIFAVLFFKTKEFKNLYSIVSNVITSLYNRRNKTVTKI